MIENNNTFFMEITHLFEEAIIKYFPESVLKAMESEEIKNE